MTGFNARARLPPRGYHGGARGYEDRASHSIEANKLIMKFFKDWGHGFECVDLKCVLLSFREPGQDDEEF